MSGPTAAADMSAALWAGWALLPAFEAVTGALVTALDLGGSSQEMAHQCEATSFKNCD
jgi:hypothetical protein